MSTHTQFAGFTWPRKFATLPTKPLSDRLAKFKSVEHGWYKSMESGYCARFPKPVTQQDRGASFYLESDFMPDLRALRVQS